MINQLLVTAECKASMHARSCFVTYCVFADAVVAAAVWLYPLLNSLCACTQLFAVTPAQMLTFACGLCLVVALMCDTLTLDGTG